MSVRKRHLRNGLFYPALAVLAAVVGISLLLLINAALGASIGFWGATVLAALFAVSMATALATTDVIPWHNLSWNLIRQPRVLGAISSIVLVTFGSMYSLVPLLKTGPDSGEKLLSLFAEKGIVPGAKTLVEQRINGMWGQQGCANTYRFNLDPPGPTRTLQVQSVMSAPGIDEYKGVFVYKSASDLIHSDGYARSTLSTEEEQGFHPGYAVDFQFSTSGRSETLVWKSKNSEQNPVQLVRCDGGPAS